MVVRYIFGGDTVFGVYVAFLSISIIFLQPLSALLVPPFGDDQCLVIFVLAQIQVLGGVAGATALCHVVGAGLAVGVILHWMVRLAVCGYLRSWHVVLYFV